MTDRIRKFLDDRRAAGRDTEPCLVVDLEVVRDNFTAFAKALRAVVRLRKQDTDERKEQEAILDT
ncbi:MAG: DUF2312 domain-containing protein, partial [Rhizobiales bacterium]|nr:DUF2312 domain-containing protein [Hyphomicrobiales bacterium]